MQPKKVTLFDESQTRAFQFDLLTIRFTTRRQLPSERMNGIQLSNNSGMCLSKGATKQYYRVFI